MRLKLLVVTLDSLYDFDLDELKELESDVLSAKLDVWSAFSISTALVSVAVACFNVSEHLSLCC